VILEKPFFMQNIEQYIDYIKFEKRYSVHTIKSYEQDLRQFVKFIRQKYDLDILQADYIHIRAWVVHLSNDVVSKRSINRKITSLRSFYKFQKASGFIDNNPAAKIKLLKTPKTLPVFVEEDNMEHLFNDDLFSNDYKGVLSKAIIDLLYATGMRVSELVNLKTKDIDWFQGQLKVHGKRNKERIIPMSDNLKESLHLYNKVKNDYFENIEESINASYFFIGAKGKKIYNKFVYRQINYYLSLVTTIKKRSPHVIRHTFATHMLNKGADLNAIKEILGHASLSATQVYTHNSIEKLKHVYKQAHPKA
jgi:integrase/recombinase XerC